MKLFFICTPQLRVCPGGNFASPCSKILGSPLGENFFTLRRMVFPPLLGQKFNFTPPSGKKNFSPREILHSPLSHLLVHVWIGRTPFHRTSFFKHWMNSYVFIYSQIVHYMNEFSGVNLCLFPVSIFPWKWFQPCVNEWILHLPRRV